jgi:hypothetical protein
LIGSHGSRYSLPLGSSENRGRHDCNHASSAPPGPRPFSWGGVTIPMVMTVRLVIRRWLRLTSGNWLRSVRRSRSPNWLRSGKRPVRFMARCLSIVTSCQRAADSPYILIIEERPGARPGNRSATVCVVATSCVPVSVLPRFRPPSPFPSSFPSSSPFPSSRFRPTEVRVPAWLATKKTYRDSQG